jgi:homoserine kinase
VPVTGRHRLVRVPASSANLGPGYDVMAAALSLTLEVEVSETGNFSVEAPGLEVPTGRDNLVVRAFESLHPADGLSFRIDSEIPLARGLGSSAAAIVAGLAAADHLYELALDPAELLARAAEIEGHPDNVAAAIHGGFVICGQDGSGPVAARFDPPEGLEAVAVIPAEQVTTKEARASIPDEIPIADAVANVGAAALLVLGLQQADLNLVARGLRDRIHQPRRRDLYPRSMELLEAATELGALGATISGAGPTLLVWSTWQDTGKVVEELERRCAGWAEVRRLPFTPHGVDVPEL